MKNPKRKVLTKHWEAETGVGARRSVGGRHVASLFLFSLSPLLSSSPCKCLFFFIPLHAQIRALIRQQRFWYAHGVTHTRTHTYPQTGTASSARSKAQGVLELETRNAHLTTVSPRAESTYENRKATRSRSISRAYDAASRMIVLYDHSLFSSSFCVR